MSLKDKIKKFFEPTEEVRARDLFREAGIAVEKLGKFTLGDKEQEKTAVQNRVKELKQEGKSQQEAEWITGEEAVARRFDPFGTTASPIKRLVGKLAKQAATRGVSKEGIKKILSLDEKLIRPFKETVGRLGKPKRFDLPSERLTKFLKDQENFVVESANDRSNIINNASKKFNSKVDPSEVIKIKQKGSGKIRITRGELEVMKNMEDLKPKVTERFFQNPIRVFEEMGKPVKELIYRPIKVAEGLAIKKKNFWNNELKQVIGRLGEKSSKRIMKFALSLEDDGRRILKNIGEDVEKLNAKELSAYKFMRFRYNRMIGQLNEARGMVGKPPIPKRKNYFTHIRNLNILEDMGFSPVTDDIETLLVNKVHRNAPSFQFAKRRKGASDIELDAFNVFKKYQESAIDNINLTPAIGKVRELSRTGILDPETGEKFLLQDKFPNAFKYINEWADFVVGQKPPTHIPRVLEKLMNKLNQNVAFATLAFNIRSAIIQPSAIINSITEIGTKNTLRGIKELMMGGGDFALQKSNVLDGRQFETAIKDIADNIVGKTGRIRKGAAQIGIKPLQILDSMTAQATWLGAYNRGKTQLQMSAKEAANFADDVVTKTQASASRSDIAKIQRSTGGKIATLFQTFVINDFNRIFRDVLGVGAKDASMKQVVKKAATYLMFVSLYNHVTEDVLGIPSPFPRPVKSLREEGTAELGRELGGQVPIVGGAVRFGGALGGPLVEIGQGILKKFNGKYTPQSWWEVAGKLFGIPGTNQLKKTIRAVKGLEDGYTVLTNDGKRVKIKITDDIDKIRGLLFGLYSTMKAKETREGKDPKRGADGTKRKSTAKKRKSRK